MGAAPGWYPDPAGSENQRYWDGQAWSQQLRPPAGSPSTGLPQRPVGQPPQPPQQRPQPPLPPQPVQRPQQPQQPLPAQPGQPDYGYNPSQENALYPPATPGFEPQGFEPQGFDDEFAVTGNPDGTPFGDLAPEVAEPDGREQRRGRRGRRSRQQESGDFRLEAQPDSKEFDLDAFDMPPDMVAPPKEKAPLSQKFRAVMMSDLAGKVLVPLAVIAGAIAALKVGTVLWAISPYALAAPVVLGLLFVVFRWNKRRGVTKWYGGLRDAVDERGLLADAVWYGPAMSLPAPDEQDRPMWNGILVVYRKGLAWFPTEDAAEKKAMWWKKKFADVALVHRSAGGGNGVGMDIHIHGGDVKCHQIPPGGWSDGAVEALTDCMYPVLDD